MLSNTEHLRQSLEQLRELVHISMQNERAREGARARVYEEENMELYQGHPKGPYAMTTEVKKRRGVRLTLESDAAWNIRADEVIASCASRQVSQLQSDRYTRMATGPRWRTNALQRMRTSLCQTGAKTTAGGEE